VASGLAAAHAAGVVHRDLKPANIMLQADGTALIMDFGIARSTGDPKTPARPGAMPKLSMPRGAGGVEATMAGVIVGTVEYMAPEQARGEAVDQRADVYAFGLILYDLLAGRSRVHPDGAIAELQARMQHAPPVLKTIVPEVPEALSRLVMRCVDPNPAARFGSAAEIVTELDLLDERGELIPVRRTVRMPLVLAMVAALLALSVAAYWLSPGTPPAAAHDPVTVVVADVQNSTSDPSFDHALEPALKSALESAAFVSAYDRSRLRLTFNVDPPALLDEAAAREIALKQGLGIVVSGSIDRRGNGYEIAIKAVQAVTGQVVSTTKARASSKEQVLEVVTRLVTTVRKALGDETSASDQMLAMRSISATSLELGQTYAAALEAQSASKYEEARQKYLKTVEIDQTFGLGYQGAAVMSRNLGRQQDAEKYINEALKYLDGMTEREKLSTRAFYYRMTGDYQQCVNEYAQLTARYAADVIAHNNRALCSTKLRQMKEAVEEIRQVVKILPKRMFFRANLAVYSDYAGDFQAAEQEVRALQEPNDLAILALAFAQLGQGRLEEARETYRKLETIPSRGPSWAVAGLADLAMYEGRFSDAARQFEVGAAADLARKNADKAARKFTSAAAAHLMRGRRDLAIAAADKALANSTILEIRFLAARHLVEAGAIDKARAAAGNLTGEVSPEPQAFGKIIEGEIALKNGDPKAAIKILSEANGLLDTWLGHFSLGRAYLEAGVFLQADSEFDKCIRRRGEALSLLADEEPTYGYLPAVYYYQGLVREGLKSAGAAESFGEYLRIRGNSTEDPHLAEVRKHLN
jgi:tetratricopeptide (TPR) repeat protein